MGRGKRQRHTSAFPVQTTQAELSAGKLPADVEPAPPAVSQSVIWPNGTQRWYTDGVVHREDGPAVITAQGRRKWVRHGKCHRDDGPAVECPDGIRAWYRDGRLHREDGPAFERPDGVDSWWLKGVEQPVPEAPAVARPGPLHRPSPLAGR